MRKVNIKNRHNVWIGTHKNNYVMDKLFDIAKQQKTLFKTSRHSAAIVYKNRIIATGVNKNKTHPKNLEFNYSHKAKIFIHAEMDAIIKVLNAVGPDILPYCSIYSLRITNTDRIANACPCQGCMDAIDGFNFKNVYWSN